jgi:methionine synthase II (cobalamin-independent)
MNKNNFEPKCLATGIGSLPYKNSQDALLKVKKFLSEIPYWPQLPKRSYLESMTAQFIENFACLKIDKEKQKVTYDIKENKDIQFTEFYEKILKPDFTYFKISKEYAEGLYVLLDELEQGKLSEQEFIKGQVTGPFTLGAAIIGEKDKPILFDPMMFDMIVNGLGMKALWQAEQFKRFKKRPIIFFDEPYLSCLGSAYTPISNEEVSKRLLELFNPLKQAEVLVGIHCCGNTDWPILLKSMADIVSFDAWGYFERLALYSQEIKTFLENGGILAFGIVPTQEIPEDLSVSMLVEKIKGQFDVLVQKGIDKKVLLKKCLITPSCGLGTTTEQDADRVLEILKKTSLALRKEYF